MGLFDKIRNSIAPKLDEQKGVMTIALAAVAADGAVQQEEMLRLQTVCLLSPIFSNLRGGQLETVVRDSANQLGKLGPEAISGAAAKLTPELRETAFAFAVDMVLADGTISGEEEKFIEDLAKKLQVSDKLAKEIIQVTAIRNRAPAN